MNILLRPKLVALCLLSSLLPLTLTGFVTARWLSETTNETARSRASTILEIKKNRLEQYLLRYRTDMEALTNSAGSLYGQNTNRLETVRDRYGQAVQQQFQNWGQETKQFAATEQLAKNFASIDWVFRDGGETISGERWPAVAANMTPSLNRFREKQGFDNVYLISAKGSVVLSGLPDPLLGKNIWHAALKESALTRLVTAALTKSSFQDFTSLPLLGDGVSAWFATPVHRGGDPDGKIIGVLAARLAPTALTSHFSFKLEEEEKNIRLHLVGPDRIPYATFDSQTPPSGGHDGKRAEVAGPGVSAALAGNKGMGAVKGVTGQAVFSAWSPLSVAPFAAAQASPWAVLAEQDLLQLFSPPEQQGKPFYKKQMDQAGYYDFFLIQPDGEVFFSVARQADFGTNMVNGKYAATNLGKLVQRVLVQQSFAMTDYEPYPPSNNEPAAFMAQPLLRDGKLQMVVALQLPLEALTTLMQHRDGLEGDGDAYLVGPDGRMRSDSIRDPQHHSVLASFADQETVQTTLRSEAIQAALAGKSGQVVGQSWGGLPVFTAFAPLPFGNGVTWAVVTETPMIQGLLPMRAIPMQIWGTAFFASLCCVVMAWVAATRLRRTLFQSVATLEDLRKGGLPAANPVGKRTDEFGLIAREIADIATRWHQVASRLGEHGGNVARLGRDLSGMARHDLATAPEEQGTKVKVGEQATQEVAVRIENNLKQIQSLDRLLGRMNHTVLQGKSTMEQALNAAKEIADRASLFAETAQQTNQLSMKAAFETVGTGENKSSRKTGVVVMEIRKLAERGRIFADEIGELSLGMSYMVENAHTLLGSISSTLQESAALTQGMGLADTAQHGQMVQIYSMTQALKGRIRHHGVVLNQLAPAAEALSRQVDLLQKELSFFQGQPVVQQPADGEAEMIATETLALQMEMEEKAHPLDPSP
ncbi:MAG: methyl-accepting chemotaxis protein [Magnetococcales bacterium]|nr:methyl-accepting chemotaxis protein [Magnetococcales bacterium]